VVVCDREKSGTGFRCSGRRPTPGAGRVIKIGRSAAATEPGRRTRRKNAPGRDSAYGIAARKLRLDAGGWDFLHGTIEHPLGPEPLPQVTYRGSTMGSGAPGQRPKESPAGEGGAKRDARRDAFPCLEAAPSRHIYVPPPMADTKRHSWMSEDRDSEALPRHSGPPPNTDGPARGTAARWPGSLSLTASEPKERQSCATGQSSPQWNRKCGEAPS
jgi:hypothetical protein